MLAGQGLFIFFIHVRVSASTSLGENSLAGCTTQSPCRDEETSGGDPQSNDPRQSTMIGATGDELSLLMHSTVLSKQIKVGSSQVLGQNQTLRAEETSPSGHAYLHSSAAPSAKVFDEFMASPKEFLGKNIINGFAKLLKTTSAGNNVMLIRDANPITTSGQYWFTLDESDQHYIQWNAPGDEHTSNSFLGKLFSNPVVATAQHPSFDAARQAYFLSFRTKTQIEHENGPANGEGIPYIDVPKCVTYGQVENPVKMLFTVDMHGCRILVTQSPADPAMFRIYHDPFNSAYDIGHQPFHGLTVIASVRYEDYAEHGLMHARTHARTMQSTHNERLQKECIQAFSFMHFDFAQKQWMLCYQPLCQDISHGGGRNYRVNLDRYPVLDVYGNNVVVCKAVGDEC